MIRFIPFRCHRTRAVFTANKAVNLLQRRAACNAVFPVSLSSFHSVRAAARVSVPVASMKNCSFLFSDSSQRFLSHEVYHNSRNASTHASSVPFPEPHWPLIKSVRPPPLLAHTHHRTIFKRWPLSRCPFEKLALSTGRRMGLRGAWGFRHYDRIVLRKRAFDLMLGCHGFGDRRRGFFGFQMPALRGVEFV